MTPSPTLPSSAAFPTALSQGGGVAHTLSVSQHAPRTGTLLPADTPKRRPTQPPASRGSSPLIPHNTTAPQVSYRELPHKAPFAARCCRFSSVNTTSLHQPGERLSPPAKRASPRFGLARFSERRRVRGSPGPGTSSRAVAPRSRAIRRGSWDCQCRTRRRAGRRGLRTGTPPRRAVPRRLRTPSGPVTDRGRESVPDAVLPLTAVRWGWSAVQGREGHGVERGGG